MQFYLELNDKRFCPKENNLVLLEQHVFLQNLFAHKVAGGRNYYYFVAIKFVLAGVISKEKLTRRGWVNLYDYYANA